MHVMKESSERYSLLFFAALVGGVLVSLVSLGCSPDKYARANTVKLKGKLTDNGEPLFVEGLENATGMIKVGFHPIVEGRPVEEVTSATVDLEGNFVLTDGIMPGEYLVTVGQFQPYPQNDLLKGKFSVRKSPIRKTIDGDTELDIDISRPEG